MSSARRAARHRRVAEEGEGFLEKGVGRSHGLVGRALAVEGPRKDRVAPRPVLMRQLRRPLRHERGLSLAPERDEGEDVRARRLGFADLRPGVGEKLGFIFAADELRRGVFDNAGDVDRAILSWGFLHPARQQFDERFAGKSLRGGRAVLQFRHERMDDHLAVLTSAGILFLALQEFREPLRGLLHEVVEVEVLRLDDHRAHGIEAVEAGRDVADEHETALFVPAGLLEFVRPLLHVGPGEAVDGGLHLRGVGAVLVLPEKVELFIAHRGLQRDLGEGRLGLHKIEKSDQRLDEETPNGDRAAARSRWFLRRGRHGGVTGAGVMVLEGEALFAAAKVARLAGACRSSCTPGWLWRSLLRPLLIVTARAIPSRRRP